MNLQPLRIGNYVYANNDIRKINGVIKHGLYFSYGYCPNEKDWIKPIELTEEWLLKFGFELSDTFDNMYVKKKLVVELSLNKWVDRIYFDIGTSIYLIEIKSVHQLQNIYFALTGEELTIKEITI